MGILSEINTYKVNKNLKNTSDNSKDISVILNLLLEENKKTNLYLNDLCKMLYDLNKNNN